MNAEALLPVTAPPGESRLAGRDEISWAEAAARLRGAAEALEMLAARPAATRQRASQYGAALLRRHAAPADWSRSGLPAPYGLPDRQPRHGAGSVPLSHSSVMRLAAASMKLYCSGMPAAGQPWHWARLARFFAPYVPVSDPWLAELRSKSTGSMR